MKKTISILLVLCIAFSFPAFALARYSHITALSSSLSVDSSGIATCGGQVIHFAGSSTKITVTLQQHNGSWQKYEEWSTTGSGVVTLSKTKAVASGYRYRVVVTASVYSGANATGSVLETASMTSDEKNY